MTLFSKLSFFYAPYIFHFTFSYYMRLERYAFCYTQIFCFFQSMQYLTQVARDGLTCLLTKTNQIVYEKWLKLLDQTKAQVSVCIGQ